MKELRAKVTVVVGGMAGSEGKGKVAGYDHVLQHVQKDKEYSKLTSEQRSNKVKELYDFYKNKEFAKQPTCNYDIDIDQNSLAANEDLNYIYKLKQYDLVQATSVVFYKNGKQIASEEMSSGEFAMLSMVLSISTASRFPRSTEAWNASSASTSCSLAR